MNRFATAQHQYENHLSPEADDSKQQRYEEEMERRADQDRDEAEPRLGI